MAYKQMRYWNTCARCGHYLDPGEGRLCDTCRDEIREEASAKQRSMTPAEVRETREPVTA